MTEETKKQDVHGTQETTRWVHKHRTMAKWMLRLLAVGVSSALYYLKRQEKQISEEEKKRG